MRVGNNMPLSFQEKIRPVAQQNGVTPTTGLSFADKIRPVTPETASQPILGKPPVPGSETALLPAKSSQAGAQFGDIGRIPINILGDIGTLAKEGTYGTARKLAYDIPEAALGLVKETGGILPALRGFVKEVPRAIAETAYSLVPQSAKEIANVEALKQIPTEFQALAQEAGGYKNAMKQLVKSVPTSIVPGLLDFADQIDRGRQAFVNHPVFEALGYAGIKQLATNPKVFMQQNRQALQTTGEFLKNPIKGLGEVGQEILGYGRVALPKAQNIMNRVARLTPLQVQEFKRLSGGESHGEYLARTGNFASPQKVVENEAMKFANSLKEVDSALEKLPGTYKSPPLDTVLNDLLKREAEIDVPTPETTKIISLLEKNESQGLIMKEINEVKRMYERTVKLGYAKERNTIGIERSTRLDSALRNWQFKTAEQLGLKNLSELNKQTQLSRFIVNKLGKQLTGKVGNEAISLTDWIVLAHGNPTAIAAFFAKRLFLNKGVQAGIAKKLAPKPFAEPIRAQFSPETSRRGLLQPKLLPDQLRKSYSPNVPQANKTVNKLPRSIAEYNALDSLEQEMIYDLLSPKFQEALRETGAKQKILEARAQRQMELDAYKQAIEEHPARPLARYANRNGELPEVSGGIHEGHGSTSKFGIRGDDIASEAGFADSELARASYADYRKLVQKYREIKGRGLFDKSNQITQNIKGYLKNPRIGLSIEDITKNFREAKGLSAKDIMLKYPDIQLKRDVSATDVYGKKVVIPEGEALTPYELRGNKVMLQDGETYVVSKNQYQNIKGNATSGEAKSFAPELKGTEEVIKGEGNKIEIVKIQAEKSRLGKIMSSPERSTNEYLVAKKRYNELQEQLAQVQSNTKYSQYQLPGGKNYKEILIKASQEKMPVYDETGNITRYISKQYSSELFKSPHWDEPNVISHIRINERTYKGKKVAFMEELQSDWSRALREKRDVPQHPLLKNWQELSIKRALQEAVKDDAKYFSWITGEQTSARYNLATQVEKVKWSKLNIGGGIERKSITIQPKDKVGEMIVRVDKNGLIVSGEKNTPSSWDGKKLNEVLGKGLADKIMEKEIGTLSGEGLKFGGEWAENLYDKQVGNIVSDLTGAKVEKLDLGLPISKDVPQFYRSGTANEAPLKIKDLKVGMSVEQNRSNPYIITDILGDGKFKAVPKSKIDYWMKGNKEKGIKARSFAKTLETFRGSTDEQSFDISTKTTTQQGIELTPEIKAKIRGEAPKFKGLLDKSNQIK